MEATFPYLIGLTGLVIALAGVIKGVLDKAELQVQLTRGTLQDCVEDLTAARAEISRLREIVFRYAPLHVAVSVGGDVTRTDIGSHAQVGQVATGKDVSQQK